MEWLINLLEPGTLSLASTILLYSFVIFAGIYLGKIKIFGVSLGVTFVLFVGILVGHLGYSVELNTLKFIQEFGLILFIFSIGMQVGPGFFSSFKEGGLKLNALALTGIALNVILLIGIYYFQGGANGNTSIEQLIGVMSGAVTNTPGLGAAQQTVAQISTDPAAANAMSQQMSMGYAAAYPLGVIGIIVTMILIRKIFRINVEKEIKAVEEDKNDSLLKPHLVTFKVTNDLISGLTIEKLHTIISCNFVISRIEKADGTVDMKEVYFSYVPEKKLIENFNLSVEPGQRIAIVGPTGCGKSTALNLICGLLKPTEGQVFFGEDDVTQLPPENRGIGVVFQNYALYPHLTVRQNILFPLQNLKGKDKLTKEQMEERCLEAAKLVQIEELMDRKPNELSGGQQQRVAIARALVKMPRVLLLDEPLSNLDARLRLQTREEIRRIQRETKITTIFVTHDQEEAMSISDLIVVMKDGVLQQIGKPQEVYDNPVNLFVAKFLGTPPINVLEGRIQDGQLYIGEEAVLAVPGKENREVYVGIRPEGFVLQEDGALSCELSVVEVMGRDISVVSTHPLSQSPSIRSIISAENSVNVAAGTVRFNLKPAKVHLFDRQTEERV